MIHCPAVIALLTLLAGLSWAAGDEPIEASSTPLEAVASPVVPGALVPEAPQAPASTMPIAEQPLSPPPAAAAVPAPDVFAPSFLSPASTPTATVAESTGAALPEAAPSTEPEPESASEAAAVATPVRPKERPSAKKAAEDDAPAEAVSLPPGFKPVRGVHLSAWVAGAPKSRRRFLDQIPGTFINAVAVPLKETDGRVYIPGIARARDWGTAVTAIPDPGGLVADIRARGLRAIARIVVFKDDALARKHPELAVRRPDGALWRNRKGIAWVDPYRREIWEYNLDLAVEAARLGFDEIQFDYIRFPSDGDTRQCRYVRADHTERTAAENIREFLRYARARLGPLRVPMSVAVFGMTTTAHNDMGIGQDLRSMAELSDAVSPMMYPSHYARGEYGLSNPNREPYKVIYRGLRDAKRRLGKESWKLRPYLQDFSMGHRYTAHEVQAQLIAAQKQGIDSFILWNAGNRYTWKALEARGSSPLQYPQGPIGLNAQ